MARTVQALRVDGAGPVGQVSAPDGEHAAVVAALLCLDLAQIPGEQLALSSGELDDAEVDRQGTVVF
jgi:hypothetical protein